MMDKKKFEAKVREHLKKKSIPKKGEGGVEGHKRDTYIIIIEQKIGKLESINKIPTADLFKIANAISGHVRR